MDRAGSPLLPVHGHRKHGGSWHKRTSSSSEKGGGSGSMDILKIDFLTQRARTTNLAVLILLIIGAISLVGNIRSMLYQPYVANRSSVPRSILSSLSLPHSNLRHLIMVPGHGIWLGSDASRATEDAEWLLEPNQLGGKNVKTFVKHITAGAKLAQEDPESLLVYSGGQTRLNSRSIATEAMSYARLARAGDIYDQFATEDEGKDGKGESEEFDRVTTEDFAMDSYENILFSIARFKEFTGNYPTRITVVGFGMKRERYEDVHRAAVRWSSAAFHYIGIDNEGDTTESYTGERIGGLEPFKKDIYGCKGALLAKRRRRNPYRRFHPYHSSAPELRELLEYCPSENEIFSGNLPW